MKRYILALALIGICATAFALVAAPPAPTAESAAQPALVPWLPSHSYPDRSCPDPRLDKPVRFWRAGLPLDEVFAGLSEQTGVALAFYPPGDDNQRLRVTLYLNPNDPPSLRDILSQLMWTSDCALASEETGDPSAPYRYYLLSTSIAAAAESRLSEDWQAAMDGFRAEWESRAPARDQIVAKLDEYGRALSLSQDELIATYYGVDDHFLAALLDPAGRASAGFLTGLEPNDLNTLLDGEQLTLDWTDLSPAQRNDLQPALRVPAWGRGRRGDGDIDWSQTQPDQITIGGMSWGGAIISAQLPPSEDELAGGRGRRGRFLMSPMLNLTGEGDLFPDEAITIRRAIGETITEGQAGELRREWSEARRDEQRQQWEDRVREAAEETISTESTVSPAAEALLSSLSLYLDPDAPLALWQVQQAVASASGLNIVSDAFYQPSRTLTRAGHLLYPDHEGDLTALQILALSALATEDVNRLAFSSVEDSSAGWVWQDAGAFLRFRSRARDLWRAAMLAPETAAWLDEWLDPLVENATGGSVDVTLDPQYAGLLADSLTDLQLEHGGKLICGDPADPTAAGRTALRSDVLSTLFRHATTFRALASLSDSQWTQLRSSGLRVTYDLTPDQRVALGLAPAPEDPSAPRMPAFRGRGGRPFGGGRGARGAFGGAGGPGSRGGGLPDDQEMARALLTLEDERPPRLDRGRQGGDNQGQQEGRGWSRRPTDTDYLTLRLDGDVRSSYPLPHIITIQLTPSTE